VDDSDVDVRGISGRIDGRKRAVGSGELVKSSPTMDKLGTVVTTSCNVVAAEVRLPDPVALTGEVRVVRAVVMVVLGMEVVNKVSTIAIFAISKSKIPSGHSKYGFGAIVVEESSKSDLVRNSGPTWRREVVSARGIGEEEAISDIRHIVWGKTECVDSN